MHMFGGMLPCVAVCCSVLQCVAVRCGVLQCFAACCSALQRVACVEWFGCCSVMRCDAVCCGALQCVAVCCSVLQCVAVCCSVLQCVAVCCSVLHCVAANAKYPSDISEIWVEESTTEKYLCLPWRHGVIFKKKRSRNPRRISSRPLTHPRTYTYQLAHCHQHSTAEK